MIYNTKVLLLVFIRLLPLHIKEYSPNKSYCNVYAVDRYLCVLFLLEMELNKIDCNIRVTN